MGNPIRNLKIFKLENINTAAKVTIQAIRNSHPEIITIPLDHQDSSFFEIPEGVTLLDGISKADYSHVFECSQDFGEKKLDDKILQYIRLPFSVAVSLSNKLPMIKPLQELTDLGYEEVYFYFEPTDQSETSIGYTSLFLRWRRYLKSKFSQVEV
jgi:hypothetical protein